MSKRYRYNQSLARNGINKPAKMRPFDANQFPVVDTETIRDNILILKKRRGGLTHMTSKEVIDVVKDICAMRLENPKVVIVGSGVEFKYSPLLDLLLEQTKGRSIEIGLINVDTLKKDSPGSRLRGWPYLINGKIDDEC